MSELHVVIVAYGPAEPLARTLAALQGKVAVTVVDNSGNPETRDAVSTAGATYIDAGANVGFAAGVNLALPTLETGTDVLLLNPDARIDPDAVATLHQMFDRDPRCGAVAPDLTDPETGQAARVTWPFPSPGGAWLDAFGLRQRFHRDEFLIGAVLLLRAEALAQVGTLDERYFLYAEEVDWQRRAIAAGWRVAVCHQVSATHVGSGTGGDPQWRLTTFHTSAEKYITKWYGTRGWLSFRLAVILKNLIRLAVRRGAARAVARNDLRLYLHGPSTAGRGHSPTAQDPGPKTGTA